MPVRRIGVSQIWLRKLSKPLASSVNGELMNNAVAIG
jgi:hypothetical protein